MVDSRNLHARKSQNNIRPMPVPIVRIFPLKETLLIPQPELRDGIFLTGCSVLLSNRSVCAWKFMKNPQNCCKLYYLYPHLAAYSVHLTIFISGQTNILHCVWKTFAHKLFHSHSIPTVDKTIQTDYSYLLHHNKKLLKCHNSFTIHTWVLLLKHKDLTLSACLHFLTIRGLE